MNLKSMMAQAQAMQAKMQDFQEKVNERILHIAKYEFTKIANTAKDRIDNDTLRNLLNDALCSTIMKG